MLTFPDFNSSKVYLHYDMVYITITGFVCEFSFLYNKKLLYYDSFSNLLNHFQHVKLASRHQIVIILMLLKLGNRFLCCSLVLASFWVPCSLVKTKKFSHSVYVKCAAKIVASIELPVINIFVVSLCVITII